MVSVFSAPAGTKSPQSEQANLDRPSGPNGRIGEVNATRDWLVEFRQAWPSSGIAGRKFVQPFGDGDDVGWLSRGQLTGIVAVHAGLKTVGFSIVTDMCLPDALEPADVPTIIATANAAEPNLTKLVLGVLAGERT